MYAIVESSGRQYQLETGRFVDIDLIPVEPGQEFVFQNVLMIVNGGDSQVGAPFVEGAKVTGRVLLHGRDRKIIVYHQRPKKGTRKKQGHRQGYTRVYVDAIAVNDKVLAQAKGDEKPITAKVKKAEAKKPIEKEVKSKQGDKKLAKKAVEKKAEAAKPEKKASSKTKKGASQEKSK